MDTNLDESLNLENVMVEFEHSEDTVVNQADISLDASGHEESIPMEYEQIEEQPIHMDTGNEEIIVSDFMGDQFSLQQYDSQEDQATIVQDTNIKSEAISLPASGLYTQELLLSKGRPISIQASGVIMEEATVQPKIIAVKAGMPAVRTIAPRRETVLLNKAVAPRQVAIAPKPAKIVQGTVQKLNLGPGKQYAIAPKPMKAGGKPVTLVANKQNLGTPGKGNTVLAIGKQLVMMPSSQKIKLMSGALSQQLRVVNAHSQPHTHGDQAQLIQNVSTSQGQGNKVVQVVLKGAQTDSNQPAVITKLVSVSSAQSSTPRVVVSMQKSLPSVSIGNNKVIMASPTKTGGIKYTTTSKSQLIAMKSPTPSLAPTGATQGVTTKKVVLSANPGTQNVILKSTPKTGQVARVTAGQKTQLHQINVPGKGIQYIRLVTNPSTPAASKPAATAATATTSAAITTPSKTFVLSDGKGNLIHMTAEKVMKSQPPPLLVTGSISSTSKVSSKPPHKLVRLAPLSSKLGQAAVGRGGQSLLAPLSPMPADPQPTRVSEDLEPEDAQPGFEDQSQDEEDQDQVDEEIVQEESLDSKAALRALIANTVGIGDESLEDTEQHSQSQHDTTEVEVEYDRRQSHEFEDSTSSSMERQESSEHPLIVIPPYMKQEMTPPDHNDYDNSHRMSGLINVEVDVGGPYDAYHSAISNEQGLSDTEMVSTELGLRPRKPCNCTKSQCLKLYCDCFANGEFCNRCNCNNCHNNLENEELRQKAIRGCLDRNPNAFRPKIGKARAGGVEHFRRHNKGCNCKRSGCLKNYCECYEAKIACTNICKCVGCRNVEESIERARRRDTPRTAHQPAPSRDHARPTILAPVKQPCSFMTTEVIEAVCQCLIAAAVESGADCEQAVEERDPIRDVIDEFARCLQDIISASHQAAPIPLLDEAQA